MQAVAHSPEFAKEAGVPQSVGREFAGADQALKPRPNKSKSSKSQKLSDAINGALELHGSHLR